MTWFCFQLWWTVKVCFTALFKSECNPHTKPYSFPSCFHSTQQEDCNFPFRSDHLWYVGESMAVKDPQSRVINPSNPCCLDWLFTKSWFHFDTFHLVIKLTHSPVSLFFPSAFVNVYIKKRPCDCLKINKSAVRYERIKKVGTDSYN